MPKTKISWEEHPAGTVSVWIDTETRQKIMQHGKPNPGYEADWNAEVSRQTGTPVEFGEDIQDLSKIPIGDKQDAIRAYHYYKNGFSYEQIAGMVNRSRTGVYKWLRAMGVIKHPRARKSE